MNTTLAPQAQAHQLPARVSPIKTKALIPFLALTFTLTWGIAALGLLFFDQLTAIFGEIGPSHPMVILCVYSPGIVGVLLVWRHYGLRGLASFPAG